MTKKKIVLFGAGEDLKKCMGILRGMGIEPYCLSDNDSSKWGTWLEGKRIVPPNELAGNCYQVMISTSDHKEPIMRQLEEMGLGDQMLEYIPIFRRFIEKKAAEYEMEELEIHDRESVLVDAFMGKGWDGDSQYACVIAAGLQERGYDVHVYARETLITQSDEIEKLITRYPWQREKYWDTLLPILKDMEQRLPFVLIANTLEYVMAAGYILKRKYPDKVRIISVVHNDSYFLYEQQAQWVDSLETIIGISSKITCCLREKWKIPEEKLYYRRNPVLWGSRRKEVMLKDKDSRGLPDGIIRIGWGGRLSATQKRADLLLALIELFERRELDYCLEIAGDGDCYEIIQEYLKERRLEDKVYLLGRLERDSMREFWQRQHVYINISEFEGSCLAMLEAMSSGVVPIVTNVSGTEDVIDNGRTGFRIEIGNLEQVVDRVAYLKAHPAEWKEISRSAMEAIKEKCSMEQYIDFIECLIDKNGDDIRPQRVRVGEPQ